MIEKKLAKKVLNLLLESGGDYSEIYAQKRNLNHIKLENSKIENITTGFELGCGLRIIHKESTFFAYVDSIEIEKIMDAARVLKSALDSSSKSKILDLTSKKPGFEMEAKKRPSCFSQSEKSELLFKADSSSRNFSPEIVQVTARISDLEDEIFIATSENTSVSASSSKVFMAVNAVAGRGNEIRTGYKSIGGTGGFELFLKKSPEELSFEAARMAVAMLDAVNAPSGSYPVVIGPAFGGVIFHEACGHGLEADSIIKDASVYKDKIGKKIASTCVTAIDDATLPYHWGSYLFDDEGYNSCRNTLIKDGVLLKYICDYKSSKKLKIDISGNARRQSYKDIPLPRMSNTYIDTGKDKPELIINSVKNGIFAKEFSGGQVDPATGDFVFGISEGYFIKNGTVSDPIKGATLIGNGPEILNKIEAVADDLDFAPGFCGKGGQSVSNEVGQPTLLVSSLTVGGTGI